jgi:penicillin amidase
MTPQGPHDPARRARRAAIAAALLAAVVAGALALEEMRDPRDSREAFPRAAGSLRVEGLGAELTLDRDAQGVPHIEAASESDAFFGLGFAHAQDRLAQMRWWSLLAQGRSAEIVGLSGVEADRLARTLGFQQLAEAQLPRLSRSTRVALAAYAAGVNAHIALVERGEEGPPLAVTRLDLPLEAWRAEDSLALLKLYAWGLSSSVDVSLVLSELIQRVGAPSARRFFPRSDQQAPLPPPDATVAAPPSTSIAAGDPLRRALGLAAPGIGSSAWVVGGAHTRSGLPIIVGDAHFEPTAPSHLYFAHVHAGDFDVVGATLPGLPVFWSGRNRHVAWASVHARAVVTDLYTETLHPADPSRYHDGENWRPLTEREEVIRVRGAEAQKLSVRATQHGPLLPGRSEGAEPISVAWTGAGDDRASGVTSMLRVAHAASSEALVDALSTHREPVVAVVYADDQGEAGIQLAGWIPHREILPGLLPLPGRARWYDWRERVAYEDLPRAQLARGEGWLVAADNRLDRADSEALIEWLWRPGVRADRIDARVRAAVASGPVGLRGMSTILSDIELPRSRRLVKTALGLVEGGHLGPEAVELSGILRDWRGRAAPESVGAAAYHVFLAELTEALFARRIGAPLLARYLALSQVDAEQLVLGVLEMAAEADRTEREEIADDVRASLKRSALSLAFRLGPNRRRWTWGALHTVRFSPFGPFDRVWPRVAGLGPHPYGGSAASIQAAAPDPANPFLTRVASTARFAIDLGAPGQILASLAPGQSGHPGHPNFRDGLARWLAGRLGLLPTSRLLVDENRVARLVLEPVR